MESFLRALEKQIKGEVSTDLHTRRHFRHDESVYELTPDAVVAPVDTEDVQALVRAVAKAKAIYPKLSITARGGGSTASGGAIGSSLVIDMHAHMNKLTTLRQGIVTADAGALLRDAPIPKTHQQANATVGGAIASTSTYSVRQLTAVLEDGNEYVVKPLTKRQLDKKMAELTYEGALYKQVFELIEKHYDLIKNARPRVPTTSAGYALWDVWDRDTEIFDLTQLFRGSQGILGLITGATFDGVPTPRHDGSLIITLSSLKRLPQVLSILASHASARIEAFDAQPSTATGKHRPFLKTRRRTLFLRVSVSGSSQDEVHTALTALYTDAKKYTSRIDIESSRTTNTTLASLQTRALSQAPLPFIGDAAIPTSYLPEILPKIRTLIRKHALLALLHIDVKSGQIRIIPHRSNLNSRTITSCEAFLRDYMPIVTSYRGTIASDNGDGMALGPWLPAIFGQDMYGVFKQLKEIFDPLYIFNPYKKTDASWEYGMSHTRLHAHADLIKRY